LRRAFLLPLTALRLLTFALLLKLLRLKPRLLDVLLKPRTDIALKDSESRSLSRSQNGIDSVEKGLLAVSGLPVGLIDPLVQVINIRIRRVLQFHDQLRTALGNHEPVTDELLNQWDQAGQLVVGRLNLERELAQIIAFHKLCEYRGRPDGLLQRNGSG